ncbi:MAG: YidC/Oxa1 family insertase periplasmic-domain containing protein, partial [Muribaculaceae bacterium]|nr:YidC/Oxa1 family insertase periplasmic-domain containing protein [Muribaculaceae bacterium]
MDKNTLTGVLLMGAIIFGFMYINKPSAEEIQKRREQQEQLAADSLRRAEQERLQALTIPEITDADVQSLRNGLALYGKLNADGSRMVASEAYELRLENDSVITGEIKTAAGVIDVNNIISADPDYVGTVDQLTRANAARSLKGAITDLQRYRNFAAHMSGSDTVIGLENDVLALQFSTKGAQISNVVLKDYDCYINPDTTNIRLWNSETNNYSFTLRSDSEKFESSNFYFTPVLESDSTLLMKLDLGAGAWWGIRYTLPEADGYRVKMDVVQHGMADAGVIPSGVSTMEFKWHQKMARFERGRVFEQRNSAIYYKELGDDVDNLSEQNDAAKSVDVPLKWIGFKNQFFSSILIADDSFNAGTKLVSTDLSDNADFLKEMDATTQVGYSISRDDVASFNFYLGPNLYPVLRDMDRI